MDQFKGPQQTSSASDDFVQVWLAALRETDKQDSTEEHLICEDHFLPEDICNKGVSSDAIPIMPPCLDGSLDMTTSWGAELSEEEEEDDEEEEVQWTTGGEVEEEEDAGGNDVLAAVDPPAPEPPAPEPGPSEPPAVKQVRSLLFFNSIFLCEMYQMYSIWILLLFHK